MTYSPACTFGSAPGPVLGNEYRKPLPFFTRNQEGKTAAIELCVCVCVKEMLLLTREVASDPALRNDDCFALCVMSHGQLRSVRTSDGNSVRCECVFGSDGVVIPTTTLLAPFSNEKCPSLIGKPKIVIFQACRGGICSSCCFYYICRLLPSPQPSIVVALCAHLLIEH